ncbi:MAG: 4'-phosphopantetheinyl transferase superfamily protein [Proteobacteria bacterium]|nr:4'-phosphopantetheinyl transferase superfamily protein [Pseudomonadota bacterium]
MFTINLKKLDSYLPKLLMYLSEKEKIQADKFQFEHLKSSYVASHGLLRILIGNYLSCSPSQVEYTHNEFQKPLCKNNQNLYFNMSHSHEYACYAFSFGHEVGVDIEFMDSTIGIDDLLPLITTQEELLIFNTFNKKDKSYLFYKTWTIKEAFVKALGFGLSCPLSNIDTTILPRKKFEVVRYNTIRKKEIDKEWTFSSIDLIPDYLGAVAVKKNNSYINMRSLDSLDFSKLS